MATYTIGSGETYETIAGFLAIAAESDVGELKDEIFDEKDLVLPSDGITLKAQSGAEHDGVAGSGARIVLSSDAVDNAIGRTDNPTGTVYHVLQDFEINGADFGANYVVRSSGTSSGGLVQVKRLIIHDFTEGSSNDCDGIDSVAINELPFLAIRNIIYNISVLTSGNFDRAHGIEHDSTQSFRPTYIVGNTIYGISAPNGNADAFGIQCRGNYNNRVVNNNVVAGVSAGGSDACFFNIESNAEALTNASDDSTAPTAGAVQSAIAGEPIIASNEFASLLGGSEDFTLKVGAECIDAGTDVGTTYDFHIDILRRDVDAEGDTWDVGAHEFVAAGGGVVAVAAYTPPLLHARRVA